MRRTLAWVAFAVTSMVALSFLIPLALLVRSEARTQVITAAEQRAAALAPVLALTTDSASLRGAAAGVDPEDRLSIHLPDGQTIGAGHAPDSLLNRAQTEGESLSRDVPGGWVYLQPVVLSRGRVAVVEEFVPQADLTRGVVASWGVMSALALVLVIGSVVVADRLAGRVVRSSQALSRATKALGSGDLDTRVVPTGPPELQEVGSSFNAMADRMLQLLAAERELVADLSHRLRTPLTVLYLAAEQVTAPAQAHRVNAAIGQLESELDAIIDTARVPLAVRSARAPRAQTSAAQATTGQALTAQAHTARSQSGGSRPPLSTLSRVAAERARFWAVLAQQQQRRFDLGVTSEPTPVALGEDDAAAVLDALIGNVFRHTAPGTAFALRLERSAQAVTLTVEDSGPGFASPQEAVVRGASDRSTGLGLDIARRAAESTGGRLSLTRGPMGGARVSVQFGLADLPHTGARTSRLRARRRKPHTA